MLFSELLSFIRPGDILCTKVRDEKYFHFERQKQFLQKYVQCTATSILPNVVVEESVSFARTSAVDWSLS